MSLYEADNGFKSRVKGHALQRDEKVQVMFDLVCMMAEERDKAGYEKVRKDWNKK